MLLAVFATTSLVPTVRLAPAAPVLRVPAPPVASGVIAGLAPAFGSYADIWLPTLLSVGVPDFLLHWGHGAAMTTVLFAMGGYGTYLGWQTRLGNGDDVLPLNLGKPSRQMHSLLMSGALFFFLLGGQGGFVLLRGQGQEILQSAHSSTAVLGLALLLTQAVLGKTMGDSEMGRSVHAYLGSATMLALVVHAYNGLQLGTSFS